MKFGDHETEQEIEFLSGDLGDDMPAMVFTRTVSFAPKTKEELDAEKNAKPDDNNIPKPISAERQDAITYLSVGSPLRQTILLETESMEKPMAALSTCIDDLMTTWGIDVAKHKSLTRATATKGNPGRWISPNDYPIDMLIAGQSAIIEFRISVDAQGNATACHIQATTRPKEFDNAVCKAMMKKAKFFPALDAAGDPIASYYKNSVLFEVS